MTKKIDSYGLDIGFDNFCAYLYVVECKSSLPFTVWRKKGFKTLEICYYDFLLSQCK